MGSYYYYIYNDRTLEIKFKSKNKILENKNLTQLHTILLNEINDYVDINTLPQQIQELLRGTKYIDDLEPTRIAMASRQFVKEQVALCEYQTHLLRGDFNEYKETKEALYNSTIYELHKEIEDLSMQIESYKNMIMYFTESYECFKNNYYKSYDLIIKGFIGIGITIILGLVVIYVK